MPAPKSTQPTLDDLVAQAAAAQAALAAAQAQAQAEAEEAARIAQARRVERGRRILAAFRDVDTAVMSKADEAAAARNAAAHAFDLTAMLTAEAAYQAAVRASSLWRRIRNSAVSDLTHAGEFDPRTAPSDMPERRDRQTSLFVGNDTSMTVVGEAISRRADAMVDDVLAEVLDGMGLGDLAEGA